MKEKFEIKPAHLKLLKNMYVSWWDGEYGAPAIDCKRPYGNSDVEDDIARILGWKIGEDGLTQAQSELAEKLHQETQTALQICLSVGKFEIGKYQMTEEWDDRSWKKRGSK